MSFTLHDRLAADTFHIMDLPLCRVLLMNNASMPWMILVPMRENIVEISDLTPEDRAQMWQEVEHVHNALQGMFEPDKMNIGALGNMVPQLHVHIICRFKDDPAWPNPVWGNVPNIAYEEEITTDVLARIKEDIEAYSPAKAA